MRGQTEGRRRLRGNYEVRHWKNAKIGKPNSGKGKEAAKKSSKETSEISRCGKEEVGREAVAGGLRGVGSRRGGSERGSPMEHGRRRRRRRGRRCGSQGRLPGQPWRSRWLGVELGRGASRLACPLVGEAVEGVAGWDKSALPCQMPNAKIGFPCQNRNLLK